MRSLSGPLKRSATFVSRIHIQLVACFSNAVLFSFVGLPPFEFSCLFVRRPQVFIVSAALPSQCQPYLPPFASCASFASLSFPCTFVCRRPVSALFASFLCLPPCHARSSAALHCQPSSPSRFAVSTLSASPASPLFIHICSSSP